MASSSQPPTPLICADELDAAEVIAGRYLTTKNRKYILDRELGRGGYGCVFLVHPDPDDGSEFALKLEKKRQHRAQAKLTMEQHIMKLIRDKPPKQRSHFIDVVDRGKKTNFFFLVMTLVGESLADLKKMRKPSIFSCRTTYAAGIQCLEAIEQLHSVGYIHRDIKPGNYAIGRNETAKTIFILDFGIARNILNNNKELKGPRTKVAFKGTVRYAPVACHKGQELGKKDDCESWLYMLADVSNPEDIPWKGEKDRERVFAAKDKARTPEGSERTFKGLDVELMAGMLTYLDTLQYADEVDYSFLYQSIQIAAKNGKLDLNAPFDWEDFENSPTTGTTNTTTDRGGKTNQKTQQVSIYKSAAHH